jgi:hypothetical protein
MMDALTSQKWPLHASEYNTFFLQLPSFIIFTVRVHFLLPFNKTKNIMQTREL